MKGQDRWRVVADRTTMEDADPGVVRDAARGLPPGSFRVERVKVARSSVKALEDAAESRRVVRREPARPVPEDGGIGRHPHDDWGDS